MKKNLFQLISRSVPFEGEPAPTPAPAPSPAPNPEPAKIHSQADVDRIVGERLKAQINQNRTLVSQLEDLKGKSTATEEEKTLLQSQIDTIKATYETKEQQQGQALDGLQKKFDSEVQASKNWRERFENKVITVDIYAAAEKHGAFSGEQIEAILKPISFTEQEVDEAGKPTGEFVSKVNLTVTKDGKPLKIKLSPEEAVKKMTELPQYANLFKNKMIPGTGSGQNNGGGADGLPNMNNLSPADYLKNREKIISQMK